MTQNIQSLSWRYNLIWLYIQSLISSIVVIFIQYRD
jgi:hypothetical protein